MCSAGRRLRLDELQRHASDPAFCFRNGRQRNFKDLFDPKIAEPLRLRPRRKLVEVSFEVRKTDLVEYCGRVVR
jgi:hypothetical protein